MADYDFFQPNLLRFISLVGEEANSWIRNYHVTGAYNLEHETSRALLLLREGNLGMGGDLLGRIEAEIQVIRRDGDPAIGYLLARWHFSVAAYLHYRNGDYDLAVRSLEEAERALSLAIGAVYFLLPFAHHCADFCFQRARVARNQRRWQEMSRHIDTVRGMMEGLLPFCVLADGSAIGITRVKAFYEALPLAPEDRSSLRSLLDDDLRLRLFERSVVRFHATLGGVIQYP